MEIEKQFEIDRELKNIREYYLSLNMNEKDFYHCSDSRSFKSMVFDIPNGDNYYDYAEYFYNEYGDSLFDN